MLQLPEDSSIYDINISPQLLEELTYLSYSRHPYSRKLMENASRALFKSNGFDYKIIEFVENESYINLENIVNCKVILLNDKNYWESLIIVKDSHCNWNILDINPFSSISKRQIFTENTNRIIEIYHKTPLDENIDKKDSGLYVLGFLVDFLKTGKKWLQLNRKQRLIEKEMLLKEINFKYDQVELKTKIVDILKTEMSSTINRKVEYLSKNKEFIKKYQTLIETCSKLKDSYKMLEDYRDKLKKNEDVSKLKENLLQHMNEFAKENTDTNLHVSIKEDYPKETEVMSTILSIISRMENKEAELKKHCTKLNLDSKRILEFYEEETHVSLNNNNNETNENENKEQNTVELARNKNIVTENLRDVKIKTMEQLIDEMKTYERVNGQLNYKYYNLNFKNIIDFCKKWENKNERDIKCWIESCKTGINNIIEIGNVDLEQNVEELLERHYCEAIAVFDRAFKILKGYGLRLTQKMALLVFLCRPSEKGLLCQIQTGEGKTYIIAGFVILKILLNSSIDYIDVITSNPVLADDAVMSCKDLYDFFEITVDTNNKYKINGPKACYKANVVYGTMASFQFDFLSHDFNGRRTRNISKKNNTERKFQCVVLDEVDNMLIDNSGNIAKLAESFPGMDSLKYIYIEIWQDLNKFLQNKYDELISETKSHEELIKDPNEFFNFVSICYPSIINEWKDTIKSKNIIPHSLVLPHLKPYTESVFDKWLDNAVYARFNCLENVNYVLENKTEDGRTELRIIPVDYTNTGVTLKNTVWSHGLHQFIQLKHNLQITTETLTSCCVSNYAYILKYDKNVFGLTGTLGGMAEQKLLSNIYNINYASIPTFKKKSFDQLPGKIVKDIEWVAEIIRECLDILEEKRAILIVCLTIVDAENIREHLEQELSNLEWLKLIDNYNIKMFLKEDHSNITHDPVGPGSIIIATNIAGRGTDLKTDDQLEDNGGLHVCVGFCPENERVRDQVLFRTSRQGNKGSARIICRQTDVSKQLNEDVDINSCDFKAIYKRIQEFESLRMENLEKFKVKELLLQDYLFQLFSDLYKKYKQCKIISIYALADLKEFWTFWFEMQNFSSISGNDSEIRAESQKLFENFKKKAKDILNGKITHNPYYYVSEAQNFLFNGIIDQSEICLKKAVKLYDHPKNCICPLHYSIAISLFEVAIESGCIFWNQLKEYLAKILFFDKIFKKSFKDDSYKKKALRELEFVEKSLEFEINYINNCLKNDDFKLIISRSDDSNMLIKHLVSRLHCLQFFKNNVITINNTINNSNNQDIIIKLKTENYLLETEPADDEEKKIRSNIYKTEIVELQLRGLNTLYMVAPVVEVSSEIVQAAIIQIGLGITVLTISSLFPVSLIFGEPIAATFISEGIMDIIISICGVPLEIDKNYYISKLIAHAINVISVGLANIMSFFADIISKARTMAYNYFQRFTRLIDFIEKIMPFINFVSSTVGWCSNFLKDLEGYCRAIVPRRMFTGQIMHTLYLSSIKITKFLLVTNVLNDFYVKQFQKYFFSLRDLLCKFISTEITNKADKISIDLSNILVSKKYFDEIEKIFKKWNLDFQQNYILSIVRSLVVHTNCAPLIIFLHNSVETLISGMKPFIAHLIELIMNLIQQQRNENGERVDQLDETITNNVMDQLNTVVQNLSSNQEQTEFDNALTEEEILLEHDPYKILGVNSEETNLEKIRRAYIKMSRKYRPNNTNRDTLHVFNKISDAYEQIKEQIQQNSG